MNASRKLFGSLVVGFGLLGAAACGSDDESTGDFNPARGGSGVDGGNTDSGKGGGGGSAGAAGTAGKAGSGTGGSSAGGSGTGGTSAGGSATGGTSAGGSATGGTSAGGSATGGTSAGGSHTGGTSAGGSHTGGTSTGGTSTGGTSTGGTSTGGTSTGGTGTGGTSACDNTGDCNTCGNCAENNCTTAYNACVNSQNCVDYFNCISACSDTACMNQCAVQYPTGAQQYDAYASCIVCDNCPNDCSGYWDCGGTGGTGGGGTGGSGTGGSGGVPGTWTCNASYYNAQDGCDCECGAWDPDCDISGATLYNCNAGEVCVQPGVCSGGTGGSGGGGTGGSGGSTGCGDVNTQPGTCADDATDCTCVGCNTDGSCGYDDDCTCPDCASDSWCVSNCADDGVCSPYNEACSCSDCASLPVCGGGTGGSGGGGTGGSGTGGSGGVPGTWTCNAAYYNAQDGCDCECGAWDPDCDSPGTIYGCSTGQTCVPPGVCSGGSGGSGGGGNPNSCVGYCDDQAPGGCYCDAACVSAGDCCSDYQSVCTKGPRAKAVKRTVRRPGYHR